MKKFFSIALLTLFSMGTLLAQTRITGKVTDGSTGEPVSYATVAVKGMSSVGAYTDDNGNYSINLPQGSTTLSFSAIGYKTQEVVVNARNVIDVVLESDVTQLEETFVIAYGTAKKSTYTGSAAVVTSEKIKDAPVTSFENALAGKVAGMQITGSSGQAGSATNIRIRGTGSMNASNEPLYVIDGVPVVSGNQSQMSDYLWNSSNVMSTLNPNDIESITVLKDAAASALYGSRAANGIIVVTTKKGKSGKAKVNLRSSLSFTPSFATDNWERATPEQIFEMYYELFWNGGKDAGWTDERSNTYALGYMNDRPGNKHGYEFYTEDNTPNTIRVRALDDGVLKRVDANGNVIFFDWEKALLRTETYQTYDLSISGGTENTTVYSSIGYTRNKGRTVNNEFSRISGRVNVTQKVGKFVELATIVGVSKTDQIGFNDSRNIYTNYFYLTRNMLWPTYWPTDYKTGEPYTAQYGSSAYNHLYYNNEWENSSKTFKVSASEALTIKFLPELSLKSIFSYDNTNVSDHLYYSANHFSGTTDNGVVHEMRTNISKWVSSTTLNFDKSFADKHNVNLLVGFEAEDNISDFTRSSGTQMATAALHTVSTAGSTTAAGYSWGHRMASVLSRAEYNFDTKYFLSASLRRDGSSRFAADHRWGTFWSLAGAWAINKEKFMESTADVLNNLRLRLAYGVNGTVPSSNYGWRTLNSYTAKYMEQPGGGLANIGNDKLTWESNYTTNVGVDFGLFNNRLRGTIEYFNRDSKNLLQDVRISQTTGFSSTLQNVGEMNNRGWEIEIGGDIIKNKEWTWDASISASFIKTKITKLYGGADIIWYGPDSYQYQYIYREGHSNLSLYGREWAGVDQTNGLNVWYTNNDYNDPDIQGFNKNVSYDYDDADQIILADMNPKVFGGINTSVSWKNLSLGLNFIYKFGGYTYDAMSRDVNDDGYYWERTMVADTYDGRWTSFNQNGRYPKRTDEDLVDAMQYSSRHKNPGSFVRLRNITLSYNLPQDLIKKVGLGSARVYFTGTNLLTFAAFKLYDPEVNYNASRGWELPIGKTYTFGIDISF